MDLLTLGLAGAGALLSAIQGFNKQSARKKQKQKYLEYLDKLKLSPIEKEIKIDQIGDYYLTGTMDALNSSIGQGNLLNKDAALSIIKSKMLGQRASAMADISNKLDEFNKNIDLNKAMAEIEMPDQPFDIGSIVSGGLIGAQLGLQIDSASKTQDLMDNYINSMNQQNQHVPLNENTISLEKLADKPIPFRTENISLKLQDIFPEKLPSFDELNNLLSRLKQYKDLLKREGKL